jgi:NAD+ kinase
VKKAVLFVNARKENAGIASEEIRRELEGRGIEVTAFSPEDGSRFSPQGRYDICLTLGGDGTVLHATRVLAASDTPILPVHLGTLGFLAGIQKNQWLLIFEQWLNGTAQVSRRSMLELSVKREGQSVYSNTCLNDAVISSMGMAKLIRLQVKAEVAAGELAGIGHYRSDGLIIATPTGSTAYSMAAGGPILDPEMEAFIVNPICPFTFFSRSLVLPAWQPLVVTLETAQRPGVLLTVDGQDTFELEGDDIVTVRHSPHYAQLITTGRSSHYSALKEKLSWGREISATAGFAGGDNA